MADTLLTLATFISSVVSVITLIIVYKQMNLTSETVRLAKDEATRRLRPWVGFMFDEAYYREGIEFTLKDGRCVPEKEFLAQSSIDPSLMDKVIILGIRYVYKNYGLLPALNITHRVKTFVNKIPVTNDLNHTEDLGKVVMMPGESLTLTITIPAEYKKRIEKGEIKMYSLIRLDYDYVDGKGFHEGVVELRKDGVDLISAKVG